MTRPAPEPPGIYVHVPFCSAVCPYCDFAVHTGDAAARETFVDDLLREIEMLEPWDPPFETIYFGGGTPSALAPEHLARIIAAIRSRLAAKSAMLSMEANPEDVDEETFAGWRELGVRFLSLGVQSFDAAELRFLGRRHGPEEAQDAIVTALAEGGPTVSCDLIFGLPGQRRETLQRSLRIAAGLGVPHVSAYQLTIHEDTPFARWRERGRLREVSEDHQADLFELVHEELADLGFTAYEVSNFARSPLHRSRHNRKYWRHVPYLGIGPSAHSFDGTRRFWNERATGAWSAALRAGRLPRAGGEDLSRQDLALEAMMLALRQPQGLDLVEFERRFGIDLRDGSRRMFERWDRSGLARLQDGVLRPTLQGLAVADRLATDLSLLLPGPHALH